jgi:hypothetical protein
MGLVRKLPSRPGSLLRLWPFWTNLLNGLTDWAGPVQTRGMKSAFLALVAVPFAAGLLTAQTLETKPADPFFEKFQPVKAPAPAGLLLQKGDRLAIIGDSITEQKMYSRIMEAYLTVCVPDLEITVRQYGWGGETAPGFYSRITNDCLRFQPTIATTCYGMNDHGYRAYQQDIGDRYRKYSTAIVEAFKGSGARFVQGSPGCVGWEKDSNAEAKNLNLCTLRNIGIEIATAEKVGFADVFWPMLNAGFTAKQRYSPNYGIAGGDRVHPGWAGHAVMAYAFLKALGVDGAIGTFTVDLKTGTAEATPGHEVLAAKEGEVQIKSSRYPFCATGAANSDNSIRSAMTLIPFNQDLNRLMLVARNGSAQKYKVTWGEESRVYSAEDLAKGVNLAADFEVNPFSEAFKKVDDAVGAKQNYETHQIKTMFHGPEFKLAPDLIVELTEKCRTPLAQAIKTAFVRVTHTIKIEPN